MSKYKIAIVPGDGIGHEIVPEGIKVLNATAAKHGFEIITDYFPYGAGYYKEHGEFLPSDGMNTLKAYDAIYFGAVGLPEVDDTLPAMMYTFKVRTSFKQYVNYRPVKLLEGINGPLKFKSTSDIDFIVIRENNEGEFVQNGKIIHANEPHGLATDTSVFTRKGIERIAHYAFQLAQKRRKKVTNVTKSNTLIHSLAYWDLVIGEVREHYPEVAYEKMYVDNASASFVLRPENFDVVLTTNMIGDILSDLGGAIMGSLGLGPSGNINPEKDFPSMFEPIHGSYPQAAGKDIANPLATVLSAAMMFEYAFNLMEEGALIRKAVNASMDAEFITEDIANDKSKAVKTSQVGDWLTDYIVKA